MSDKRSYYTQALNALAIVAPSQDLREACEGAAEAMQNTTSGPEGREVAYAPAHAVFSAIREAKGEKPIDVIREGIASVAFAVCREDTSARCAERCEQLSRYVAAYKSL